MKTRFASLILVATLCLPLSFLLLSCGETKADPKAGAPPPASVEPDLDANNFKVDHPEQFPLVTAVEHKAAPALNVTGVVQPDIARAVPVISLASGRVVEIKARLGDAVKKGQLLLRVCRAPTHSPFPICRTSGSSATFTKMISTPCASASTRISA